MGEAAATGYAYVLPGAWLHLDLAPDRLPASVRRAVALRVRREPELAAHRQTLDRLLYQWCAPAASSGAQRVSLLAERVGDQVGSAAVTFGVHDLPDELTLPGVTDTVYLDETVAGPDGPMATRRWHRLWTWPGRPQVGLLTMASPCPALWPELGLTFAACVASFRWTFPPGVRREAPRGGPAPASPSGDGGPPH